MSIVLGRNDQSSGFGHGMTSSITIYKSPEFSVEDPRDDEDDRTSSFSSSSSSSSIGRNSDDDDDSDADVDGDAQEVQSSFKPGGGLDNLEALEEVLPIKRSISKFYAGKSKSFTSLADAASISSVKEIVKPEDAYSRKRKNLLAHNNIFGKNRSGIPGMGNGGIYKRPINSRSSSALKNMSCSDSNNSSESLNSSPSSPCLSRPPLPPQTRRYNKESSLSPPEQKFSAWRSFSLSDLQGAAAATVTPSLMGIKE
ncbi:protein OXIDATIVE STRESS 3 LIKE 2-like [Lycium ferocissimum]|uniref:protein OXIDATIVE STRESS 3 LIKE 2-like n=1 Tax=Lycium ferocissimum TaxID=112874 RepID=UPI00281551E2|nr:protein OXIDATIVE STRESS 3 LIKE 2-like [Lycium ferocissimum]